MWEKQGVTTAVGSARRQPDLLLAGVRSQISSPPSAHSAPVSALDVAQNFISLKAINR
jgi:hypothetical protein